MLFVVWVVSGCGDVMLMLWFELLNIIWSTRPSIKELGNKILVIGDVILANFILEVMLEIFWDSIVLICDWIRS